MNQRQAVEALHAFARETEVVWRGRRRTWASHVAGGRYADEEALIQPQVFPEFARRFLNFEVGATLAPEVSDASGQPDFTPADLLTHPFVFETKGTEQETNLRGSTGQIERYLRSRRIKEVVLTNLVGIRVVGLDAEGHLEDRLKVDLRLLYSGPPSRTADHAEANRFFRFLTGYSRQELTTAQKVERVRRTPDWDPFVQFTDGNWIQARIARVVEIINAEVAARVNGGALADHSLVTDDERGAIVDELRNLLIRFGVPAEDVGERGLDDFVSAQNEGPERGAMRQYVSHVAYWLATKLVLVRIWEDLRLLAPTSLYNGGFDVQMTRFDDAIQRVIDDAFVQAGARYRALFTQRPTYSWYEPSAEVATDAIYELATTYFGSIQSDVLGQVYERMLQRLDRKLLGQYYTPRDVISLIWGLVLNDSLLAVADSEHRPLRVLDIACGSGGFLVEGIARLRARLEELVAQGSALSRQAWLSQIAEGFNGVEKQRFSTFLAELNLLIQFSQVLSLDPTLRIPELGIIPADTLSLHNPQRLTDSDTDLIDSDFLSDVAARQERAKRIKDPDGNDFRLDIAIGNPPYIGEKSAAFMLRALRERYPYWDQFVAAHPDYFYSFLILGISKLRPGGRFGFITTEYWMRAGGAAPLRKFIAERCNVERILLFRDLRLFPDALGQHSLVITGEVKEDGDDQEARPVVSVYSGPNCSGAMRARVLQAFGEGRTVAGVQVASFRAPESPNKLGAESWAEVVLPLAEVRRRRRVRALPQVGTLTVSEGVIATAARASRRIADQLPAVILDRLGGRETRAGIFNLHAEEVRALGRLTAAEAEVLRPVINTADVLPYAAVVREGGDRLIYLPKPGDIDTDTPFAVAWQRPFPAGMPRIEEHLRQFKPFLERRVEEWGERRPWWTLHRARQEIVDAPVPRGAAWADYCVTTRWGGGGRLVVGLSPAGAVPASGLHALRVLDQPGLALYLCGLFNSTMFQDFAASMPPGQIRAADLQQLGLPEIGAERRLLVATTTAESAALVTQLAVECGSRFPTLQGHLRADNSLSATPTAWLPTTDRTWGTFASVGWASMHDQRGNQAKAIDEVRIEDTLFGRAVIALHRSPAGDSYVALTVDLGANDADVAAVASYVEGLAAQRLRLNQLQNQPAPVAASTLATQHHADVAKLTTLVGDYRARRSAIDGLIAGE